MYELYASEEFERNFHYDKDDLGAVWTPLRTDFRVWAPTATQVFLNLYQSGRSNEDDRISQVAMQCDVCGTWKTVMYGNLDGTYYTFTVVHENYCSEICDPYARAVGINGKRAMVIDLRRTNPQNWEKDSNPNAGKSILDAIIYELHLRDISMNAGSGVQNKGKYLGLTEVGTKTRRGSTTGLSHLKELGVTHVQILPIYDFGSVDEREWGKSYNWGYDPENYNAPEGSYASDPEDGAVRISELKQMIQALHQNGLSVVMDVVYNHVYHRNEFPINQLVPNYFSRTDAYGNFSNGTGCGNDTASERSMVRKFIVDSICYWADEYHIDGFRFDLAGILDTETISEIIERVHEKHPDVIFYGEGWNMSTQLTKDGFSLANQENAARIPSFSFFNDTLRDSLRGSVFNVSEPGFITGALWCRASLEKCFRGDPDWAQSPAQTINYASCHDNHTLFDRIACALPNISDEEHLRRNLLAAAFVLLSQGVPFFQAGEELLKSKRTRTGRFVKNSYRSSDQINAIKWSVKDTSLGKTALAYYKGLISIRKALPCFRYETYDQVYTHISTMTISDNHFLVFCITEEKYKIIVAFNGDVSCRIMDLPDGNWTSLVEETAAGLNGLSHFTEKAEVAPLSALLLIQ